jgi:PAS domain S-box-containing protein
MKRLGYSVYGVLVLLLCAASVEASGRNVLLLQSLDRGNLTLDYLTGNFRVDLDANEGEALTFTQFVVNPSGFDVNPDEAVLNYLAAAYANRPKPDLIVTMAGPAAAFARKHRDRIFPDRPMMFAGVDQRFLTAPLRVNETAVAVANNFAGNVDEILQLFPDTSTVFMVMGSGELSKFWRSELEREFSRFGSRVTFIWSNTMSYADILRKVAQLPARSAILHLNFGTDGQGGAYSEDRVLADIHAVANAPLFGTQSTQIGHGVIGGTLMSIDEVSRKSADVALRILSGTPPAGVPAVLQRPGPPVFDWRELSRWNVSTSRLPANSVIRFQQPGVWERFKWGIIAGTTALLAQAVLIGALLVNRAKRRRAEQSLRESEARFRVLANSAPVMIRMADATMLCTDFNNPWLNFTGRTLELEAGNGWVEGVHRHDVEQCVDAYKLAAERREPFRIEYRLRRCDGEYRWLLESWQPRVITDGAFAGFIGSAIDVTDLKAARATLSNLNHRLMEAQEQERTRLARELHDDVSQRMTLLAIELEQLRGALPEDAADAHGLVAALNDAVADLGKDIQAISHRLHSSKLDYLGLASAAGSFCREVSAQRGLKIEFVHENVPVQLPDGVGIAVFRVLQEAVANAIKHSGASQYRVALRGVDDRLRLEVVDDGCGFDVEAALGGHGLGLISMRERLRAVDGDVTIESEAGAGTRVCVDVPLQTEPAENVTAGVGAQQLTL